MGKATLLVNETMGEAAAAPEAADSMVTTATTMMSEVLINMDEEKASNVVGGKRGHEEMMEAEMAMDADSMMVTNEYNSTRVEENGSRCETPETATHTGYPGNTNCEITIDTADMAPESGADTKTTSYGYDAGCSHL